MKYLILISLSCLYFLDINAQIPKGYELYWEDDFEGISLNSTDWGYRALGKRRDAYNVKEAVNVNDGHLILTTKERNDSILTGMISTQGKVETTYGYFEIRCKLQRQKGHWSAFWLQSSIFGKHIDNPEQSGVEVDIYEYLPNEPKKMRHALHYDGYGEHLKSIRKSFKKRKFKKQDWHTFGVEWTEDYYQYYVDGKPTFKIESPISEVDQYLIISLEVGDWAGNIQKATLPDSLLVDYVRIYKKEEIE